MTMLVERLHGYDLRLLAPGTCPRELLAAIRQFRADVYGEFSCLPSAGAVSDDSADPEAWHLLVCRAGALVGCIRFVSFDPVWTGDLPTRVLVNSRCEFSAEDQGRCLSALAEYARQWRSAGGPFVQVGGLAVARSARRSAVGPALCLAGNAFLRLVESAAGVAFAADKTGGAKLYARAGCFPLAGLDGPLGLLDDAYHRDRILVMGIAPYANVPELEAEILELCTALARQATGPRAGMAHRRLEEVREP